MSFCIFHFSLACHFLQERIPQSPSKCSGIRAFNIRKFRIKYVFIGDMRILLDLGQFGTEVISQCLYFTHDTQNALVEL